VTYFADETQSTETGPGRFELTTASAWNIGTNANGGYALAPLLRAMATSVPHPDPITMTTHFLRPVQGELHTELSVDVVRTGTRVSTLRGELAQGGKVRLITTAAFGDLAMASEPEWSIPAPDLRPPDECLHRSGLEQGIDLPILSRCDVRIRPDLADAGSSDEAVIDGWIRLVDGEEPSVFSLPLFSDAFPPSVFPRRGFSGWVPTIELTVHVRRRPAPGWIQARFEVDDLDGGLLIESGTLWDSTGAVVARSRQLGMLIG